MTTIEKLVGERMPYLTYAHHDFMSIDPHLVALAVRMSTTPPMALIVLALAERGLDS